MAIPQSVVTHAFVSGIADGVDATKVRPSNWNANHVVSRGAIPPAMANLISIPSADFPTIDSFLDFLDDTMTAPSGTAANNVAGLWVEVSGLHTWPMNRTSPQTDLASRVKFTGAWTNVTFTGNVTVGSIDTYRKTLAIDDAAAAASGLFVPGQLLMWWGDGVNYSALDTSVCKVVSIVGNVTTLEFMTTASLANGSVASAYCDIQATFKPSVTQDYGQVAWVPFPYIENIGLHNMCFGGSEEIAPLVRSYMNTIVGYYDGDNHTYENQWQVFLHPPAIKLSARYIYVTSDRMVVDPITIACSGGRAMFSDLEARYYGAAFATRFGETRFVVGEFGNVKITKNDVLSPANIDAAFFYRETARIYAARGGPANSEWLIGGVSATAGLNSHESGAQWWQADSNT